MTEGRRPFVYPELDQAVAFHKAFMSKLGLQSSQEVDETKLKATLERSMAVAQGRGDILTLAAFLMYGLIRDEPFGPGSTQTGMALTLAFLLRNGVAVMAPDDEIAGLALGIGRGEVFVGMAEMWLRESARPFR